MLVDVISSITNEGGGGEVVNEILETVSVLDPSNCAKIEISKLLSFSKSVKSKILLKTSIGF